MQFFFGSAGIIGFEDVQQFEFMGISGLQAIQSGLRVVRLANFVEVGASSPDDVHVVGVISGLTGQT
jgi:hypothetical protein